MSSTGITWSTNPPEAALCGIPGMAWWSNSAWLSVRPPCSLTAAMPSAPSLPNPDRMMAIAFSPWSSASDARKVLTEVRRAGGGAGWARRRVPPLIVRMQLGGMTWTVFGATAAPSAAARTGIPV